MRATGISEQLLHLLGKVTSQAHRSIRQHLHTLVAAERLEVTEVELKAIILRRNDFADFIEVGGLAVRRKPHDLAFVTVLRIADELADHRVHAAKRVRQKNAIENLDLISLA